MTSEGVRHRTVPIVPHPLFRQLETELLWMTFSRVRQLGLLSAALLGVAALVSTGARSQEPKEAPPKRQAKDVPKAGPGRKRPDLPPSKLPLELIAGERIALVGNATAER